MHFAFCALQMLSRWKRVWTTQLYTTRFPYQWHLAHSAIKCFIYSNHLMCFYIIINKEVMSFQVNVARLSIEGKMMNASKYGAATEATEVVELTEEEREVAEKIRETWKAILNIEVDNNTDFFKAGAGSMDVVRYEVFFSFFTYLGNCLSDEGNCPVTTNYLQKLEENSSLCEHFCVHSCGCEKFVEYNIHKILS